MSDTNEPMPKYQKLPWPDASEALVRAIDNGTVSTYYVIDEPYTGWSWGAK